jgi:hypothetical protein
MSPRRDAPGGGRTEKRARRRSLGKRSAGAHARVPSLGVAPIGHRFRPSPRNSSDSLHSRGAAPIARERNHVEQRRMYEQMLAGQLRYTRANARPMRGAEEPLLPIDEITAEPAQNLEQMPE